MAELSDVHFISVQFMLRFLPRFVFEDNFFLDENVEGSLIALFQLPALCIPPPPSVIKSEIRILLKSEIVRGTRFRRDLLAGGP